MCYILSTAFFTVDVAAPVVTMEAKEKFIPEGSKVELHCDVQGVPEPTVMWMVNTSKVTESVYANGSLIITMATMRHSGVYTCVGLNSIGSDQSVMTLHVQPPSGTYTFTHTDVHKVISCIS